MCAHIDKGILFQATHEERKDIYCICICFSSKTLKEYL